MQDLRRLVGSLDNLSAFEAAARHCNFTKAARQLSVTQPAISRRIKELEGAVGVPLFERYGTRVRPTAHGQELLAVLTHSFGTVTETIRSFSTIGEPAVVTVRVSVAASLWMLPEMADFYAANDDIRLHLVCIDEFPEFAGREFDIELRFGLGDWPDVTSHSLLEEEVFPIASPDFLARHKITRKQDLRSVPLLQLNDFISPLMDWQTWLGPMAGQDGDHLNIRRFTTYAMVKQAAILGHGVGLGFKYYVADAIESGAIRPVLNLRRKGQFREYVVVKDQRRRDRNVGRVVDWILALAERTRTKYSAY